MLNKGDPMVQFARIRTTGWGWWLGNQYVTQSTGTTLQIGRKSQRHLEVMKRRSTNAFFLPLLKININCMKRWNNYIIGVSVIKFDFPFH